MERRKQIEIEEQEIRRKEKELMSTVKLPAEAEAYKVQTIAEGKRFVCILYCYVVLYTGRKILEKIHLLKTASRYSKNTYIHINIWYAEYGMPFHSEHYERHAIFSREIVYILLCCIRVGNVYIL